MANRALQQKTEIESQYPGSFLKHRVENGLVFQRPDGQEEHRYSTGPWHWMQPGDSDWREIDTDLEARADSTWKHGVKSARFETVLADDGRRRFYPRRWITGEYVEFGALQYQRLNTTWATVPVGTMSRVANRLVGSDLTASRFEIGFNGRDSRTHLILKTATIARPIRWQVTLVGLTWDNGALVSQSDAARVGFIRPPYWTDASENPTRHEIPWVYSGVYITLTPDFTGAVYPITVDPDYSIAAAADDGRVYSGSYLFNATDTYVTVGNWYGYNCAWFRFTNIVAAQGADCTTATLTVVCSTTSTNDLLSDFYGVDEDNHAAPTDWDTWLADHGIHTTATVAWDDATDRVAGTAYVSPNLSGIFDELFGRANWVSGNAVGLHWDDGYGYTSANHNQNSASYENTSYTEPVLSLTLAAGSTPEYGTATLSGAGTVAAAAYRVRAGTATLSGSGSVTAIGSKAASAKATVTGTGTVVAAGRKISAALATLQGAGLVTVSGVRLRSSLGVLSGAGTVTGLGLRQRIALIALAGLGSLASTGTRLRAALATLVGAGLASASSVRLRVTLAVASGLGVLASTAVRLREGVAALLGIGLLNATGEVVEGGATEYGSATMSGVGTVQAIGNVIEGGPSAVVGDMQGLSLSLLR